MPNKRSAIECRARLTFLQSRLPPTHAFSLLKPKLKLRLWNTRGGYIFGVIFKAPQTLAFIVLEAVNISKMVLWVI